MLGKTKRQPGGDRVHCALAQRARLEKALQNPCKMARKNPIYSDRAWVGGNEVSDIELYGYKKDAKYIVKIAL